MYIFIHTWRHIKIYYQFDIDKVKPSSKDSSAYYNFILLLK